MKKSEKALTISITLLVLSTLFVYAAILFESGEVSYNNDTSGMRSTNVQDAIDELFLAINSDCKLGYSKGETTAKSYICNKDSEVPTNVISFNSSNVKYDNTIGMEATTVQGAINELASKLSTRYCIDDYEMENETSTSYTCVQSSIEITFNANGGTFANNETTKTLTNFEATQSEPVSIVKYSHTSNIDDTGLKLSDYGNYWSEANIAGTDRGDTTKAHVITIPGARSLTVDIYYNSEESDWVSVLEGNYPEYVASHNTCALSLGNDRTRLRGSGSESYIVNGNLLEDVLHSTYIINGDTVTFGFSSNYTGVGQGYGYYAVISATNVTTTQTYDGTYEEPKRNDGYTFAGWLSSSDGNIYSFEDIAPSQNTTYTAQWKKDIVITVGDDDGYEVGDTFYCPIEKVVLSTNGENITLGNVIIFPVGDDLKYGSYPIVPSNATLLDENNNDVTSNYNIIYVPGTLTVDKVEPTKKVAPKDVPEGKPEVITVSVPSDMTGYAYAIISEVEYRAEIINGKARIVIDGLKHGRYTALVGVDEDDKYYGFTVNVLFTVEKATH